MSRITRLIAMLTLSTSMFIAELVAGYWSGSIALIADSFHMLSDVLSLVIALYAIRLANRKNWTSSFTYGWQRAEVLGALINGVFLLALCFTIIVEALQRFFEPVDIERPVVVLAVGGAGLVVNILGLFLFHEHGHSHGGGHSHGHSHDGDDIHDHKHGDKHDHKHERLSPVSNDDTNATKNAHFTGGNGDDDTTRPNSAGSSRSTPNITIPSFVVPFHRPRSHSRLAPHSPGTEVAPDHHHHHDGDDHSHEAVGDVENNIAAAKSNKEKDSHGHSHGGLNMHGVFLHVLGDALGSVAVIISALVIWLSDWEYRQLLDPILSLLITAIILSSTIPLVKNTCRILLQGLPDSVAVDDLRNDILALPLVVDIHELHVWQLSDTKLVASIHVVCHRETDFMLLAGDVKNIFHMQGIHSATIQPEYIHEDAIRKRSLSREKLVDSELIIDMDQDTACLLRCAADLCSESECCPQDIVRDWGNSPNNDQPKTERSGSLHGVQPTVHDSSQDAVEMKAAAPRENPDEM
eukprot:Partr_v1_DN26953_c0_g1_i1_m6647 putative solute carrier family 30 (zinc transporter), member 1